MKILSGSAFAIAAKILLLTISLSILGTLSISAFAQGEVAIAAFLIVVMGALAVTYLTKFSIPMKFFLPGMIFLSAFVVVPVLYTILMSGFQYQTGNYISKPEAIDRVSALGIAQDESGTTFDIRIGKSPEGELQVLASDTLTGTFFISTPTEKFDLQPAEVKINEDGVAEEAPGFTELVGADLSALDKELNSFRFFYSPDYFLVLEGFDVASLYTQSLTYDAASDSFKNIQTGVTYTDNGRGNYADAANPDDKLSPGWRSVVWFENYVNLFTDPKVSGPLFSVFIWTMFFATFTVITQFALGLLLALALDKKIRGRRFYRIVSILPYAMPSIMSILIWGGMFDSEFGAINTLLGTQIAWFQDPNFARAAVLVVNLWLGFPYFYLVSSGSLQAIPTELAEAASIDGANARQIFGRITLPLLLKILTPLLISSFAFNFNNFNLIFLLTGGGPRNDLDGEIAGATDILISYTYKIAFGSDVQNLGLASAISVVIFVLVASISLYGVRKSKVLDDFV